MVGVDVRSSVTVGVSNGICLFCTMVDEATRHTFITCLLVKSHLGGYITNLDINERKYFVTIILGHV